MKLARLWPLMFVIASWVLIPCSQVLHADERPRLLVLTDIGGDPDDQQSLIRLMLYSNEFEIEGLIASAAGTPGELKEAKTRPDLIRQIVNAYGEVRPNLAKHLDGYPPVDALRSVIKSGNAERGLKRIGEEHDTEGSRWIIETADRVDPRPLNITIWGGQTDLAQALWRVRQDRGDDGLRKFLAQLRVFDIDDQDRLQPWIFENFPSLFYVLSKSAPKRDKREGAYRGMYLGGDESTTSREWLNQHVRRDHGPLGALYPARTWTDPNPHGALKEGDTPSWFFFRPIGLNDPAHPEWGGLGGRFRNEKNGLWRDVADKMPTEDGKQQKLDPRASVWRWRTYFQNDFQARLDWCVKNVDEANHAPTIQIDGRDTIRPIERTAKAGLPVSITAHASDRDGNHVSYRWWIYRDAGTFDGEIPLQNERKDSITIEIPQVAAGKSIHVVLEATDDGSPPLTSIARVVLNGK
ncbi:MAG: nucleoside hydrolase-like domain-containing protein [Planctomycetaceae bacterium]